MKRLLTVLLVAATMMPMLSVRTATACPFCSAVGQTFTQEIEALDVAVIVNSIDLKEMPGPEDDGPLPKSTFQIVEILKGEQWAKVDAKIETQYFGERKDGTFLIFGADAPDVLWTTPIRMTDRSVEYLRAIMKLPDDMTERLKFFQSYLEDDDEMLNSDAYDEFARAPYETIIALKPHMKREEIIAWIQGDTPASRRRLYLTMLGVCGEPQDADLLEKFMRSDSLDDKLGLDAMIACYLTLKGKEGMPLVKELFLTNEDPVYSQSYSAIMALRFHAAETDVLPRESIVDGLRCILDRNAMADLVIPDLARMEDWESLPRLVELFKTADPAESWARVPIINFVRACPLPEAEAALEKLKEIDPAAVKRASTFFAFARKRPKAESTDSDDPAEDGSDAEKDDASSDAKVEATSDPASGETNKKAASIVPQQTLYARTVSAEIALPDLGDDMLATSDEFAAAVQAVPRESLQASSPERATAAGKFNWFSPLVALAGAGLILINLVDWRPWRRQRDRPSAPSV